MVELNTKPFEVQEIYFLDLRPRGLISEVTATVVHQEPNKMENRGRYKSNKSKTHYLYTTRFIQFLSRVLCWMSKVFIDPQKGQLNDPRYPRSHMVFSSLLLTLDRVLATRGTLELITYVKAIRSQLLNYLSGNKEVVKGIRVTSDGIPCCLGDLIPEIRRSDSPGNILPYLSTILYSTRSLKPNVPDDTSTVDGAPKQGPSQLGKYLSDFWRTLRYDRRERVPRKLRFKTFHFSPKSGPNGHALGRWLDDLDALPDSLRNSIGIVGGFKLSNQMDVLRNYRQVYRSSGVFPEPRKAPIFRKIVSFPDMEGKKRIVAELDYFSQASLRPLHFWVFDILKKIPQDRTFDQWGFVKTFDNLDCDSIYSVDLTAATDRFPIRIIEQVLKGILPTDYVDHWSNIMVGYPFRYGKSSINYSTGNPMGAYSSWATFALTHHYLVYHCCRELGIDWKSYKYCLLGDDIVLTDSRVGDLYIDLISSLGVEVSPLKTHRSRNFFEFAKRYFNLGKDSKSFMEFTPFPVSALKESGRRSYLLTQLLLECQNKGWCVTSIPSAVSEYYRIVQRHRARNCKVLLDKSVVCEAITKVIRGSITADDGVYSIVRHFGLQVFPWNSHDFLSSIAVELFADSNPENNQDSSDDRSLGGLAILLVCFITSIEFEDPNTASLVIQYCPTLACYGRVEEQYLELRREARRIDTIGKGDWPLILRSFTLPSDDNIFVMRSNDVRSLASYVIGKKLLERFRMVPAHMWRPLSEFLKERQTSETKAQ